MAGRIFLKFQSVVINDIFEDQLSSCRIRIGEKYPKRPKTAIFGPFLQISDTCREPIFKKRISVVIFNIIQHEINYCSDKQGILQQKMGKMAILGHLWVVFSKFKQLGLA